ncbi:MULTISPECIES: peroxiredoxin family protein [unclassified Sphingomonas]|jgi:peroxiredoxin|uniref:peroxiredoxin family protein n=1 Tax=unclassified Sphingomonas TaxID=196159 RepID=UPI00082BBBE0|nr:MULTISPECIES: peroxiredoxin family protein [unclassified Sphingomonas]MCH4893105.1 redoxin domain-containing protein [Sphingomonas sp. SFZ2018-12]
MSRLIGPTLSALLLAPAGIAVLATSPSAPALAQSVPGPAVGGKLALGHALRGQDGKPTTLQRQAAGKPIMVVLFRSAKWCPYCQTQLKGLGDIAAQARAKGVRFVAVSYDDPAVLADFAAKQNIAFPLLSDAGGAMANAWGLRDPRYPEGNFAYGVPYPTVLVLDAKGRVKAKSVETDYKKRPSTADLLAMLAKA